MKTKHERIREFQCEGRRVQVERVVCDDVRYAHKKSLKEHYAKVHCVPTLEIGHLLGSPMQKAVSKTTS